MNILLDFYSTLFFQAVSTIDESGRNRRYRKIKKSQLGGHDLSVVGVFSGCFVWEKNNNCVDPDELVKRCENVAQLGR